MICKKRCSQIFRQIHRKTSALKFKNTFSYKTPLVAAFERFFTKITFTKTCTIWMCNYFKPAFLNDKDSSVTSAKQIWATNKYSVCRRLGMLSFILWLISRASLFMIAAATCLLANFFLIWFCLYSLPRYFHNLNTSEKKLNTSLETKSV